MKIQENINLRNYNTFKINVSARYFADISYSSDINDLLNSVELQNNKSFLLGGGSNVLFKSDYNGLIIHNSIKGIRIIESDDDQVLLECGGGNNWHDFVSICIKNKYYGLENLALIPGTVGAAPVQNIGAYGIEQNGLFHSLTAIELKTGERVEFSSKDCEFGYRDSIFKNKMKGLYFITKVKYRLSKHPNPNLTYKELKNEVEKFVVADLTPEYIFQTVQRIRNRKLPDLDLLGNSGSFFKNPEVSLQAFKALKLSFNNIPGFSILEKIKIPAAWLIEQSEWKGKRIGDAGVSDKHALILVNHGNARGSDILSLAKNIRKSVFEKFGINLEYEVNII